MMDKAESNVYVIEELSSDTESLDEETRSKLVALTIPNIFFARKGSISNCMDQMMLLE